ncbi:alpha-amylase family protein [candidate division KSB1 bacterium]
MKIILRSFIKGTVVLPLILFFILIIVSCVQRIEEKNDVKVYEKPAWLKDAFVLAGSNQEPLIFRLRRGTRLTTETISDYYNKEHSEERMREAKEFGGTYYCTHLFKGFGMEAEGEELKYAKELAGYIHKYGMKVGTYVGSTMAYETFLLEKPEAEEWLVPDYLGEPAIYSTQYFRRRPYIGHPEYVKYIKEVVRVGIEELGTDLIHFDNPANQARPEVFHHPLAIEQFRDFLRKKYTKEMLKRRIGFSDVSLVIPPKFGSLGSLPTFDDPITQEWIDFRCQKLSDYYGEMERHIRKLNSNVAVEINPHGITGVNRAWESSVDFPRLLSHTDVFYCEDGNDASFTKDGILVSNIRSYKMGRTLDNVVFNGTASTPVMVPEVMAFNRSCLGRPGQAQRKYIKFFHDNFEYYREADNIADVAVLRSFPSMAYNNYTTHQSTVLFEQVLIQAKIPFDIIFDENLKDLTKYSVLVLANQECLRDDQLLLIRKFVEEGGGLVATEYSSLYNEWRRRRPSFGLKDLFKVEQPQSNIASESIKNEFGDGRVVYIPNIKPSIERPATAPMRNRYWKLPINWVEMVESVKWAASNELSIEVNAPLTVAMELTKKRDNLMVHLVNYDMIRNPFVRDIEISLKIEDGKEVGKITLLSPDDGSSKSLDFSKVNGRVVFTIPLLETYRLAVLEL